MHICICMYVHTHAELSTKSSTYAFPVSAAIVVVYFYVVWKDVADEEQHVLYVYV